RPPPSPPLFPYTTLFRSSPQTPRSYFGLACASDDSVPKLSPTLKRRDENEHPNRRGEKIMMPSISFLSNEESLYGSDTVTRDKRSEEHTSELQSRENLVC